MNDDLPGSCTLNSMECCNTSGYKGSYLVAQLCGLVAACGVIADSDLGDQELGLVLSGHCELL